MLSKGVEKILMLISAIDLSEPLGGTICWWQFLKALNGMGVSIIVVPFIGKPIETPWWRCYPNPTANINKVAYSLIKRVAKRGPNKIATNFAGLDLDRRIGRLITKKWSNYTNHILHKERNIDAIVLGSLPLRIFENFSSNIKSKWKIPLIYFELDMPEVLPDYNTFGYSYYKGTDLSVYDGFISNSEGANDIVRQLGAQNTYSIHFAIDPDVYKPFPVRKDLDILFSGLGSKGREKWIEKMILLPARNTQLKIAISGNLSLKKYQNVAQLGYVPFSEWLKILCSSRINLNISRLAHANVYKTSTYRIFELCGMGCAVVTNPHRGIEAWYRPRKEIYVLSEDENPSEVYASLLSDEDYLAKMGESARERTLKEHTYIHRALSFARYLKSII